MVQHPEALGMDILDFGIEPVVVSGDVYTNGSAFGTASTAGGLVFLPDINSQTLNFSSPPGGGSNCVDVALVPLPMNVTETTTILLEEDFSGTPGADLTTKGWNKKLNTIQLHSTNIDEGNSGRLATGNYARYTQAFDSNIASLDASEELIIEWSVQYDSVADGWVRVGVNKTNSTLGYGQTYNTQDVAIGHTSGSDYGANGNFPVSLSPDTLYDMRTVVTDTTIAHEYKERSSSIWNVANFATGTFSGTGIDEAFIDGQNSGFLMDTLSVKLNEFVSQPPPLDGTWVSDGTGSWTDSASWSTFPAVPTTSDHSATFADAISAPTTVVVDSDVTINAITFDHSVSYVVGGAASITLGASDEPVPKLPTLTVAQGDHQFQVATNLWNDTTANVATGSTLTFNNALNLMGHKLTKSGGGMLAINNVFATGAGHVELLEGTISGSGIVSANVMNQGGTISPGNIPRNLAVPEPCGGALLFLGLSVLLSSRQLARIPFTP